MPHAFDLTDELGPARSWRHRDNGLSVITWPSPVAPVVGFGVIYRVGSRHERAGHTGATHILEHLMFKGSERYNRDAGTEIARLLHRVGAEFNATTWLDRTNYYEVLPVEHLGLAIDIEADRMRGALVRDQDLASERTVVLNELEIGDNDPFELLLKESFAHAYQEHPYRHPTIGLRSDVENVSAEVLRSFYNAFYHPNNATVVVAGDVEEGFALEQVERGFGAIPSAPRAFPEDSVQEPVQPEERRFELRRAGELGCLALSWHIREGLHPDAPALEVLTQVLSDGVTSRLHQSLVETNRCLGVRAYALELHDPGLFQIVASLAPGVEHQEVEDTIRDEITRLRELPPSPDEVARANIATRTDIAFQHESPGRIIAALTEAVAMGDWRRFPRQLELVSRVRSDDLQRVAAAYLEDERLTVGWFVPEGGMGGGAGPAVPHGPQPCFLDRPLSERVVVHRLENAAQLAVLSNPHAPTVTVAGTLQAGPAYATDGRFTVPGLTAAMLERGTSSYDRLELARELEDHGLQLVVRASGSAPTTVSFSGQGLAEELPRIVRLLTEMLRRPSFPADELAKLKDRALGALLREQEETQALAYAAFSRRLYPPGHPLHRRPIETRRQEIESLTRDDLAAFHDATFGPTGMVLAVVGDVAADRVAAVFRQEMAGWSGAAGTPADRPADGEPPSSEELIDVPDRPNLDVFLGHRGRLVRGDEDYAAAVLANSCLGQSTLTSRLGLAVRDREGLSYGISSRFFGTLQLSGPWATFLSVSRPNLERAVALCRSVLRDYVADGPTEDELADERLAQAGAYRVGLATNSGVARELVTLLTAGQSVEQLDRYPDQLLATDRDLVLEATRRHIRPDELVLTAAGTISEG
jgi:zinc protease